MLESGKDFGVLQKKVGKKAKKVLVDDKSDGESFSVRNQQLVPRYTRMK